MSSSRNIEDTYEAQNDQQLDLLHSKLRTLRGVTTDIYEDVERQNLSLDDTRNTFQSFGDSLSQSARRAGQAFGLTSGGVKSWRLIGYCIVGFLGVWLMLKIMWWWWPSTPTPAQ
ncbi:hypothetical protein PHLGIDRAFT_111335 [Phlebiopsis gigantea 11061_1 CR5-6]|uniref:t-SNARE coiled-coil homology domain-containing protein n=1 Tax=Phlebiopsis gigantea (strain 11061_1 CR5-6) TaxID=745531 RepID=A0A0C3RS21_PHLG1|nr:hypothetical protein PHLGIDRAFT_111335 [Phlebiopsis gigantea 11061_1 CR5-6]